MRSRPTRRTISPHHPRPPCVPCANKGQPVLRSYGRTIPRRFLFDLESGSCGYRSKIPGYRCIPHPRLPWCSCSHMPLTQARVQHRQGALYEIPSTFSTPPPLSPLSNQKSIGVGGVSDKYGKGLGLVTPSFGPSNMSILCPIQILVVLKLCTRVQSLAIIIVMYSATSDDEAI